MLQRNPPNRSRTYFQALLQFCAAFQLYCSDHRLRQAVYYCNEDGNKDDGRECGICSDNLPKISEQNLEEQMDNVWSPCCSKWYLKIYIPLLEVNQSEAEHLSKRQLSERNFSEILIHAAIMSHR